MVTFTVRAVFLWCSQWKPLNPWSIYCFPYIHMHWAVTLPFHYAETDIVEVWNPLHPPLPLYHFALLTSYCSFYSLLATTFFPHHIDDNQVTCWQTPLVSIQMINIWQITLFSTVYLYSPKSHITMPIMCAKLPVIRYLFEWNYKKMRNNKK